LNRSDIRAHISLIFFSFVCSAVPVAFFTRTQEDTDLKLLASCISMLLLLSSAYSSSVHALVMMPLSSLLFGAVSAVGLDYAVNELTGDLRKAIGVVLLFAVAVPLHFLICVDGMRSSSLLRSAVAKSGMGEACSFRRQDLMMFASLAVSFVLVLAYVVFR